MDLLQYAFIPLIVIAALFAALECWRAVRRRGARIWVNVYGLGVVLYALIVYSLTGLSIIDAAMLPAFIRWWILAVMCFIYLSYHNERREKW